MIKFVLSEIIQSWIIIEKFIIILFLSVLVQNKIYPQNNVVDSNYVYPMVSDGNYITIDTIDNHPLTYIKQEDIFEYDHQSLKSIFDFNKDYYTGINIYDQQFISPLGILPGNYSVIFDGVLLNSSLDGLFDFNLLSFNFVDEAYTLQNRPNHSYNYNDVGGELIIYNEKSESKKFKIGTNGGNNYGNTYINFNGSKGNYFWDTRLNYLVSNGYKSSSKALDSIAKVNENNDIQRLAAFIKAGFFDKNSNLSLSYLVNFSNNDYSGLKKSPILPVIKSIDYRMHILNLVFFTNIDKVFSFGGNLYFKSLNRNNNGIISENQFISVYNKINESSFGFNLDLQVLLGNNDFLNFDFIYRREKLNLVRFNQNNLEKYELEHVSFTAHHSFRLYDHLFLSYNLGVLLTNPLYSDNKIPGASQNCYDGMLAIKYFPISGISILASAIYNSSNPKINYLFPSIIDTNLVIDKYNINSNKSYNLEIKYQLSQFNIIIANFTHSSIDNNYRSIYEGDKIVFRYYDYEFDKIVISAKLDLFIFNMVLNYTNLFQSVIQFEDYNYQIFTPKNKISIVLNKKYEKGTNWQIEYEYFTKIDYVNLKNGQNYSIPYFKILNMKIGQSIYKNYNLYIRINNILDEANIAYPDSPLPGFNYSAGVDISF